jgi:hypothetical protein
MRSGNARYSANPGDIAMQSNLICVPTLAIVKARPADPERRLSNYTASRQVSPVMNIADSA